VTELDALIAVSRAKPKERALFCPSCKPSGCSPYGAIELTAGVYRCACGFATDTLRDLVPGRVEAA